MGPFPTSRPAVPAGWPWRAPHIPAVDHDGPGVAGVERLHFFQELEHPNGGERHSEVGPASEVQLGDEPWGFAALGELLHGDRCELRSARTPTPPSGSPPSGSQQLWVHAWGRAPQQRRTRRARGPGGACQLWACPGAAGGRDTQPSGALGYLSQEQAGQAPGSQAQPKAAQDSWAPLVRRTLPLCLWSPVISNGTSVHSQVS